MLAGWGLPDIDIDTQISVASYAHRWVLASDDAIEFVKPICICIFYYIFRICMDMVTSLTVDRWNGGRLGYAENA